MKLLMAWSGASRTVPSATFYHVLLLKASHGVHPMRKGTGVSLPLLQ